MNLPAFEHTEGQKFELIIPQGMQLRETVAFSVPDGAEVSIVSHEDSQAAVSLILEGDAVMKMVVESNATLSVTSLQVHSGTVSQQSDVREGGSVHMQNISLAEEVDHQLRSYLKGEHAVSDIDWIFYAKNSEKQKLSARNIFEAGHGGGEIVMKGVAEDTANVSCDGMIAIGLEGGGTDTYLTENVLMLDTTAKVNAVPGLEIKTNDVKASHSATVSKVTAEDLFYFASRGIDEESARQMYIQGFLGDLTVKIADEDTKQSVQESIEAKLLSA